MLTSPVLSDDPVWNGRYTIQVNGNATGCKRIIQLIFKQISFLFEECCTFQN